jgi:hypothetical protein
MAKEPFEQFAMPNEVRAFVEQSVAQARTAFDGIATAANKAVSQWHSQAQAARAGASEIAHKSMAYAEQNMAATFDFAQKLMQAKDPAEVMRLQLQMLSTQTQELGQSAAKIVMDAAKQKP